MKNERSHRRRGIVPTFISVDTKTIWCYFALFPVCHKSSATLHDKALRSKTSSLTRTNENGDKKQKERKTFLVSYFSYEYHVVKMCLEVTMASEYCIHKLFGII